MLVVPFNTTQQAFTCEIIVFNSQNNKFVKINALWDTGASISTIPGCVVKCLDIKSVTNVGVKNSTGFTQSLLYRCSFFIDGKTNDVFVSSNNLDFALIGMDIIGKGKMYIENINGNLTMYFEFV
ncbi:MAG: hypothetical protein MJZ33_14300 [Paludibacteraceae bacterium]|nr:hypothetical protein [Paludibacteraceae bacterium]